MSAHDFSQTIYGKSRRGRHGYHISSKPVEAPRDIPADYLRDGRIVRLRLMIGDLPGQLARVAGLIGKAGGNIVEVQHQRLFGVVAKATELDVTVETRGRDHMRELVKALEAEGFKVRVLEGAEG
jgi:hypothetical protein